MQARLNRGRPLGPSSRAVLPGPPRAIFTSLNPALAQQLFFVKCASLPYSNECLVILLPENLRSYRRWSCDMISSCHSRTTGPSGTCCTHRIFCRHGTRVYSNLEHSYFWPKFSRTRFYRHPSTPLLALLPRPLYHPYSVITLTE